MLWTTGLGTGSGSFTVMKLKKNWKKKQNKTKKEMAHRRIRFLSNSTNTEKTLLMKRKEIVLEAKGSENGREGNFRTQGRLPREAPV